MSYKTNPITNRLTINKGWKNPNFPTKALNYSREMVLWFKIYLLLKAYLSLQQIQLLACEIRISDANTKLLYLSVNQIFEKTTPRSKSKWEAKSLLQKSKSPLTIFQRKNARFLLYQDFKTLKKISTWALNRWQKKVLSRTWISKNRMSSWVNTTNFISRNRKQTKLDYILYNARKRASKLTFQQNALNAHQKYSAVGNTSHGFWKRKQKQILSFLAKLQKEVIFFEKSLKILPPIQTAKSTFWLQALISKAEAKKKSFKKSPRFI